MSQINYYYIDSHKVPSYYENFTNTLRQHYPDIVIVYSRHELKHRIKSRPGYQIVITDEDQYTIGQPAADPIWIASLRELSNQVDMVFALSSEMFKSVAIDAYSSILKECPNVYFITPGFFNQVDNPERYLQFQFWLNELNWTYGKQELRNEHYYFTPYKVKPRSFDILLGSRKLHRDHLYNNLILDPEINEKNWVSYYKSMDLTGWNNYYVDKKIISDVDDKNFHTGNTVRYQVDSDTSVLVRLSFILPRDIYNQTNFTLIPETNFDNEFSFFTEKTAKPILARRMFIALSGYKFLENLRREGFRTFDGIVDESYDLEPNHTIRWNMVYDQIKKISLADPEDILERARPIVDHNYFVITQTNWCIKTIQQIQKRVKKHIKNHQKL